MKVCRKVEVRVSYWAAWLKSKALRNVVTSLPIVMTGTVKILVKLMIFFTSLASDPYLIQRNLNSTTVTHLIQSSLFFSSLKQYFRLHFPLRVLSNRLRNSSSCNRCNSNAVICEYCEGPPSVANC
jgi:hypothetical protein